jgi:hypothetical protein
VLDYRDDRGQIGTFARYCHIDARRGLLTGSRCSNARERGSFQLARPFWAVVAQS